MPFKPPLTRQQLIEIRDRNKGNKDVSALLWEIKRLHAIVLRADQLQRSLRNVGDATIILSTLREELEGDPIIAEDAARRKELLNP